MLYIHRRTEDRPETTKYLQDLQEVLKDTPFNTLSSNYVEQLRASLNYSPELTIRDLFVKKPEPIEPVTPVVDATPSVVFSFKGYVIQVFSEGTDEVEVIHKVDYSQKIKTFEDIHLVDTFDRDSFVVDINKDTKELVINLIPREQFNLFSGMMGVVGHFTVTHYQGENTKDESKSTKLIEENSKHSSTNRLTVSLDDMMNHHIDIQIGFDYNIKYNADLDSNVVQGYMVSGKMVSGQLQGHSLLEDTLDTVLINLNSITFPNTDIPIYWEARADGVTFNKSTIGEDTQEDYTYELYLHPTRGNREIDSSITQQKVIPLNGQTTHTIPHDEFERLDTIYVFRITKE